MTRLTYTPDADSIEGTSGSDFIVALDGNDTISTGGGGDTILAGSGNDLIDVSWWGRSTELNYFDGGTGIDTVVISTYVTADEVVRYGDSFLRVSDQDGIHIIRNVEFLSDDAGTFSVTSFADSASRAATEEDDILIGTPGDDVIVGLGGDDLLDGGEGDDQLTPGQNAGEDRIVGSPGDDTIDLSASTNTPGQAAGLSPHNSVQLYYKDDFLFRGPLIDLNRIDVNFDAEEGAGNVTKGLVGTDSIIGFGRGDGHYSLSFVATTGADTFNLTGHAGTTLDIWGWAGSDEYTFDLNGGTIRLNLRGGDESASVDLAEGRVLNDSFGNSELLTLVGEGQMEIRTGHNDDSVIGSEGDDSFILEGGNDTLDGRGGFDTLRLDQAGAGSVYVNLSSGLVTGNWTVGSNELNFGYTVTNVEAVQGSNANDDTLIGMNDSGELLIGNGGDDQLDGRTGNDTLIGGEGVDTAVFGVNSSDVTVSEIDSSEFGSMLVVISEDGTDFLRRVENFSFLDGTLTESEMRDRIVDLPAPPSTDRPINLSGTEGDDSLEGATNNDLLRGLGGNDTLNGGDGADTLNGGDGDDVIRGGATSDDLRDVIYAGAGNDSVDAGAGNDLVYGQGGNDTIAGGFGADELQGQDGDDIITGSAFSDLVFGGAGNDFVNGGFGHDRINGGAGADKFFHVGAEGHGSDWVQDYNAAEGDVLLFGIASATRADFQVNFNHTENSEGERAGDDAIMEAFVIYRPTGQIMWALVDGEGQPNINLQIGSDVFDLVS